MSNVQTVQDQVRQLVEKKVFTLAEVARGVNYAQSTVSTFLGGKYSGRTERLERALYAWLRKVGENPGDDILAVRFIETTAAREVIDAIDEANESGVINVCIGKPGCGKTMAVQNWERRARHEKIRFVSVSCNVTEPNAVPLLRKIAEAMGENPKGASYLILERIANAFRSEPRVLIVDEAQHLALKGLEAVRAIYDETQTGIVLLGSEGLYRTLVHGDKSHIELQQLQDRIHRQVTLRVLSPTEFARFVHQFWGKPVDLDVVGRLKSHSSGFPRRLVRILTHARAICAETQGPLSPQVIDDAACMIFRKEAA